MKPALLVLVLSVAAICPRLEAATVFPPCVAGSLQSYIDSSGCFLGAGDGTEVVFSMFAFPAPSNPDGLDSSTGLLDASQIELTPVASGLSGSFDFSGDFTVPAGDTVTYNINYFLFIDPGPILGGGSLHLDPTGNVSVTESICADSFFSTDENGNTDCAYRDVTATPQSFSVNNNNPPASLSTVFELDPPADFFASIETAIVLTGGETGASSGGVVVTDTVAAAPEPVTSLLCLGGLIAIGVFRRRFMV
jgi:hypothetical protein